MRRPIAWPIAADGAATSSPRPTGNRHFQASQAPTSGPTMRPPWMASPPSQTARILDGYCP
jgi:hypothetical protein